MVDYFDIFDLCIYLWMRKEKLPTAFRQSKLRWRTPQQGGCPTITDSNKLTVIFCQTGAF